MIGIVGENTYSVRCDYCVHGVLTVKARGYIDTQNEIEKRGWTVGRDRRGDWQHRCPDCK